MSAESQSPTSARRHFPLPRYVALSNRQLALAIAAQHRNPNATDSAYRTVLSLAEKYERWLNGEESDA